MMRFVRRLTTSLAIALMATAVAAIATPGISSANCDLTMSWNWATGQCKPPPAAPAWYTPAPAYAPSFAGQDVPPPPPWPWWSPVAPTWSVGFHQWGVYLNGVWVPL
ncbi:hypothetical protein AWC25_22250 [Mycobacterium sherrisii]|uniref:Secreted protein n=2 Tax=Mycobacterium sherrisii TaxID=243061 RepID=A0A1E3T930_9MYCO|nr:hypothetical protein [Mycobacterium sherrisii]ODR10870.1 hypothetical protein BHQ21_00395 [Mycobacterium sherrisii]ORW86234.1 hypothetical protein AWC25_22250 [Mycobacterium sherrisii]